jgi:hypothetical protein
MTVIMIIIIFQSIYRRENVFIQSFLRHLFYFELFQFCVH